MGKMIVILILLSALTLQAQPQNNIALVYDKDSIKQEDYDKIILQDEEFAYYGEVEIKIFSYLDCTAIVIDDGVNLVYFYENVPFLIKNPERELRRGKVEDFKPYEQYAKRLFNYGLSCTRSLIRNGNFGEDSGGYSGGTSNEMFYISNNPRNLYARDIEEEISRFLEPLQLLR